MFLSKHSVIESIVANTFITNSNNNNTNTTKKFSICKHCLKEHDYKECQEKFKFYTFDEANLLTKVGLIPRKRTDNPKPEERVTTETPWIKRRLENSVNNNNNNNPNVNNNNYQQDKTNSATNNGAEHQKKV